MKCNCDEPEVGIQCDCGATYCVNCNELLLDED